MQSQFGRFLTHPWVMAFVFFGCVMLAVAGSSENWNHMGSYMQAVAVFASIVYGFVNTRKTNLEKFAIDRWYDLIRFRHEHPGYFDESKTVAYRTAFVGDEQIKYDSAARMAIALVDDMYHFYFDETGKRRVNDGHFAGTIDLWVRPHKEWFQDHRSAYSPEFYRWATEQLNGCRGCKQ